MKLLFTFILLILTTHTWSQADLGIGLVSIKFDNKTVLHFYKKPTDKTHSKTIEFFDDQTIHSWNIRNFEKQKEWLKPEMLWLDYSAFVFRCKATQDDWFQVITNNENGETYWLRNNSLTTFSNWENYLKGIFGMARLPDKLQKIRVQPTDNAKEITYKGEDCFAVKAMKGDWIEIYTPDYCDEGYTDSKTPVKSGWIRWRKGNELLIDYFWTS